MRATFFIALFFLTHSFALVAQNGNGTEPRTVPLAMPLVTLDSLPAAFNETSVNDLRHKDLSKLDFRESFKPLLMTQFDSRTIWPAKWRLPDHFHLEYVNVFSSNPGCTVREAAKAGHLGTGTSIVVVGPPLLTGHEEYRHRLASYNPIGKISDTATVDGTAWVSIMVGKTTGIAFDTKVHYYAIPHTYPDGAPTYSSLELLAALKKTAALSTLVPKNEKITAVVLPYDIAEDDDLFDQIEDAIEELESKDIAVITSDTDVCGPGTRVIGIGREPLRNPEDFLRWRPALYWYDTLDEVLADTARTLYLPLDSRRLAAPTGLDDFALYRSPSRRWLTPYLAAAYTVAKASVPELTLNEFFSAATGSGVIVKFAAGGNAYELRSVLHLLGLIETLQKQQ